MNQRVTVLERTAEKVLERLDALERNVAVILSNYVTKEDLHRELHALTWKIIGVATLLVAAVFYIARHVAPPIDIPAQPKAQVSQTR